MMIIVTVKQDENFRESFHRITSCVLSSSSLVIMANYFLKTFYHPPNLDEFLISFCTIVL